MAQGSILVVGDSRLFRANLSDAVVQAGYEIVGNVSTGEEALESVRERRPDLVLMDLLLGGEVDSTEAAQTMRKEFDLPVIFLSEGWDRETADRANAAEPYGYLTKPIRKADLLSAIALALHRHKEQQDLRAKETLLSAALNAAGEAVIVTDEEGYIRFCNRYAESLFERNRNAVAGQPFGSAVRLVNKVTGGACDDLVRIALLQGKTVDAGKNLAFVDSTGSAREVEGEIAPCRAGDAVCGTVLTFRDVTVRNRLEEMARQEAKSRAAADLAGALSHQIGPILKTALLSTEEAIEETRHGGMARASLETVRTRIEDLSRISGQLLTLSRNKGTFPAVTDLNAIVEEACANVHGSFPEGVRLVTDLSLDLSEVLADSAEIQDVVERLVIRAREGIEEGEVTIRTRNCSFERRLLGGEVESYVTLTIACSGTSLSQEEAARFFDPAPESGDAQTVDLSSYLIHRAIRDSKGAITAAVLPGEGLAFEILLPQACVSASGAPASVGESAFGSESVAVLLVERDAGVRQLLANQLEGEGYEVLGACNGAEAEAWLELYDAPIALLVSALRTPDTSGPELAQELTARHPRLRSIFLRDEAAGPLPAEGDSSGNAAYLTKPFQVASLLQLARQMLGSAGAYQTSASGCFPAA